MMILSSKVDNVYFNNISREIHPDRESMQLHFYTPIEVPNIIVITYISMQVLL